MTLDDNGVALAFAIAGISAGFWGASLTLEVHAQKRRLDRIEKLLFILLEELVGPSAEEAIAAYAVDRDPGRVLDDYAARLSRPGGKRATRR